MSSPFQCQWRWCALSHQFHEFGMIKPCWNPITSLTLGYNNCPAKRFFGSLRLGHMWQGCWRMTDTDTNSQLTKQKGLQKGPVTRHMFQWPGGAFSFNFHWCWKKLLQSVLHVLFPSVFPYILPFEPHFVMLKPCKSAMFDGFWPPCNLKKRQCWLIQSMKNQFQTISNPIYPCLKLRKTHVFCRVSPAFFVQDWGSSWATASWRGVRWRQRIRAVWRLKWQVAMPNSLDWWKTWWKTLQWGGNKGAIGDAIGAFIFPISMPVGARVSQPSNRGKIFTGKPWVFTIKLIRLSGFDVPIIQVDKWVDHVVSLWKNIETYLCFKQQN